MNGPTRRLARGVFAGFALLLLASTWYQVIGSERYRSDPRNVRSTLNLSQKERGLIIAVDGTVLARSEADPTDAQAFIRSYPEGSAYAHVVGYTSLLLGSTRLEAEYQDQLRSRRDLTISDVLSAVFGRDLRPANLELTLDPTVQEAAAQGLEGARGAVVALDPRTGAVLAYYSSPSFDPNLLLDASAVERNQELLDDPAQPRLDRAGQELVAPGSSFKIVVSAAAIEAGVAGPETLFSAEPSFDLPRSTASISNAGDRPCGTEEEVTLQTAFVLSCNTVFADLAIQLGAETVGDTATLLGFNTEIDFPWNLAMSSFPAGELEEDPAALGQSGIGERNVRATPLVMAMVAAAVANEGQVMQPYVVKQIFDSDGEPIEATEPLVAGRAMSPATAAVIERMMERVVTEGTGTRAAIPGIRVAGKTGTAAGPDGLPDVWFTAFAPVEAPRIAIAVMLESGGGVGESATGGSVAAPIAADIILAYLDR
jgi:peptidoglycan glycosyltransferase